MSRTQSWIADKQNEQQFQIYKRAIQAYDDARAERAILGAVPTAPSSEPATAEQADAAIALARRALDAARSAYLHRTGPVADRTSVARSLDNGGLIFESSTSTTVEVPRASGARDDEPA